MTAVNVGPAAWCPAGIAPFQTSFADSAGTAAHIVGWALEYVWPLHDWLNQLVGDQAEVARLSHEWDAAARDLAAAALTGESALRMAEPLDGKSARALRAALELLRSTSRDASEWSEAAAASLDLASRIVTALHDAVAGALSELAELIGALFDFSFSLSSLNPFDRWDKLCKLTDHVDSFVHSIQRLLEQMFDAFEALVRLLHALGPIIDEAALALRALVARMVDAAGYAVAGPLGDIFSGAFADVLKLDPHVSEIDVADMLNQDQRDSYNLAMGCRDLSSLSDFVKQNEYTDGMGGHDRTVIDIKTVRAADGSEHYVVSLPSTLDWNILKSTIGEDSWADIFADYPATNDLDTNVMLMLSDHPELATQYQRGVYEAMRQAGIPEGADVVYTGFSQGGIMAGALAADRHTPYDVMGIVTTGAPIDRFDIPADVEIAAFGHRTDIVPQLDEVMDGSRVVLGIDGLRKGHDINSTITLDDPTPIGGTTPNVHSHDGYQQSVAEWEAANPDQAARISTLLGGDVVDHQTYGFQE